MAESAPPKESPSRTEAQAPPPAQPPTAAATPAAATPSGQPQQATPQRANPTSPAQGQAHGSPATTSSSRSRGGRGTELKLAAGRFILKNKLGGGSFGEIFRGVDTWRNKDVAVKLEHIRTRHPQLNYESRVYRLLHHGSYEVIGVPEVYWFGQEGEFNAMVMDLLGPCLEDLFNYCLRKFSLKTILLIADQMLHRMETLHTKQFIHRDIKPENFVLGVGTRGHHVYVLDFGLSKKYWDARTRAHINYKDGKALTGTARYCSANAHRGIEVSRRDDLESVAYLLLYFYKGSLPWQGLNAPDPHAKTVKIGEKKMTIPIEELCRDCPPQFLLFLKYSRDLRFDATPDYEQCRNWFKEVMNQQGFEYDWVFDWIVKRDGETRPPDTDSQSGFSGAGASSYINGTNTNVAGNESHTSRQSLLENQQAAVIATPTSAVAGGESAPKKEDDK